MEYGEYIVLQNKKKLRAKPRHLEHDLQELVVLYIRTRFPNTLFTIAPNGMKLPIWVAKLFKRLGYRKGTSDILVFEPRCGYHGLFIELKVPGNTTTTEQDEFIEKATARGYKAYVCVGYEQAIMAINEYLTSEEV